METMQVSYFKTTIAAQLRKVQNGESIIITDHNRPVAIVSSVRQSLIERNASKPFEPSPVRLQNGFLGTVDNLLNEERGNH